MRATVAVVAFALVVTGVILFSQQGKRWSNQSEEGKLSHSALDVPADERAASVSLGRERVEQHQTIPESEVRASSKSANPSGDLARLVDAAGVSAQQRLNYLQSAYHHMHELLSSPQASDEARSRAQFALVQRCVASILHANGRAEFVDPLDVLNKTARLPECTAYELCFSADMAVYRFARGEFSCFEALYDALLAPDAPAGQRSSLDGGFHDQVEALYGQALDTFDSPSQAGG